MAITQCTITGSLADLTGLAPANLAALKATLYIKNENSFMHGSTLIGPFEVSAVADGSGNFSLPCIETTTPGIALQIFATLTEGTSIRTILFNPAVIPNQSTIALGSLTLVRNAVW